MWKPIIKDLLSDILGGAGVTFISVPLLTDITDLLKLGAAIGGVILVVISIKIKLAIYREIKKGKYNNNNPWK